MKSVVTKDGVLIPQSMLRGVKRIQISKQAGRVVVQPITSDDPIWSVGSKPGRSGLGNLAAHHDDYLYGSDK